MLAKRAGPAEAAAVVKADAYGLGAAEAGRALAKAGCRRFYVAWPAEGEALRAAIGAGPEIAVFHGPSTDTLDMFRKHDLQPVLNSLEQIALWRREGEASRAFALHLDTGMNRLGVHARDWAAADAALGPLRPRHLLSHLVSPDIPESPLNAQQLFLFESAIPAWAGAKKSLSSTGGVYLNPRFCFDEVRPGIGLYGGGPTPPSGPAPLPVVTLTAHILRIGDVGRGETTGYGASWTSDGARRLATLGIGYADGFLRSASNRGYGVVKGEKRPIVGRVSMDLTMLDVTGLDVAVGDEVELLGAAMPIAEQAAAMGTIDYEILTRLGPRFARSYAGAG